MTRASEIADFLLSTGIGDTDAAWKAEVAETIVARWPDVTEEDLTAAFQIAVLETASRLATATVDHLVRAARAADAAES